jgi:hypothetical protein
MTDNSDKLSPQCKAALAARAKTTEKWRIADQFGAAGEPKTSIFRPFMP